MIVNNGSKTFQPEFNIHTLLVDMVIKTQSKPLMYACINDLTDLAKFVILPLHGWLLYVNAKSHRCLLNLHTTLFTADLGILVANATAISTYPCRNDPKLFLTLFGTELLSPQHCRNALKSDWRRRAKFWS